MKFSRHHSPGQPGRPNAGLALLEMMVALGISGIILAVLVAFTLFTARTRVALANYNDLNRTGRNALDVMSRDIRQAAALTSYATNQLVFSNLDGGTFSYTYNPQAGTLVRSWTDGRQTVLLSNCDYLAFSISQRSPSNDFTFYPAASAADAKLVDVNWDCSRQILGIKGNTEIMQTAKIVIRN